MKKPVVLMIDDHKALQETVKESLKNDGYDVIFANSSEELNKILPTVKFDIVLLDVVLPDADGLSLIEKIREYTTAPIIVISSKSDMIDKIIGLERGADDYVSKPLPLKELSSRIKAQLRRQKTIEDNEKNLQKNAGRITFGRWTMDYMKIQVFDEKDQSCNLSPKEFRLLESLVKSPNCVLSREQILDKTRPEDFNVTDRAVDMQILRIRKKIGDSSDSEAVIQTVRGVGYMLAAKVHPHKS